MNLSLYDLPKNSGISREAKTYEKLQRCVLTTHQGFRERGERRSETIPDHSVLRRGESDLKRRGVAIRADGRKIIRRQVQAIVEHLVGKATLRVHLCLDAVPTFLTGSIAPCRSFNPTKNCMPLVR
jgi:hypothetical protein